MVRGGGVWTNIKDVITTDESSQYKWIQILCCISMIYTTFFSILTSILRLRVREFWRICWEKLGALWALKWSCGGFGVLVEVEVEDMGLGKHGTIEVVAIISQPFFWDEIMRWIWHWFPSRTLDIVLSMLDDGNERERESWIWLCDLYGIVYLYISLSISLFIF